MSNSSAARSGALATGSSGRDPRLDVIRAFAIALVFAAHLPTCPPGESRLLSAVTIPLVRGGWVGVDLFFALSGYLIAGLLFREYLRTDSISLKRFLIRRGFKIYPALWIVVAVTVLAELARRQALDWGAIMASLFFYGNYHPALWGHFWSLAVEEHFYIVFPSILVLTRPRARESASPSAPWPWLPPAIALLVVTSVAARWLVVTANARHDVGMIQYPTHLRSDALAIGVLLAYFETFRPAVIGALGRAERRLLLVLGLVMLLPAFAWDVSLTPRFAAIGFSLYPLAGAFMIVGAGTFAVERHARLNWIAFLGARSYSLYLWHLPVFAVVFAWTVGLSWFARVGLATTAAIIVGVVCAEGIEIPALAIRDRYFPTRTRGAGAAAP